MTAYPMTCLVDHEDGCRTVITLEEPSDADTEMGAIARLRITRDDVKTIQVTQVRLSPEALEAIERRCRELRGVPEDEPPEPGTVVAKVSCPCCDARIEVQAGDDDESAHVTVSQGGSPVVEKVKMDAVSKHRRPEYRFGQIPNKWAEEACGSPVLAVTCAVDVHADNLAVAVFGWCRGSRCILLDYWRFEGNTENLDDEGTWGRLRELIDRDVNYVADDGTRYRIDVTLIDSGFRADTVYRFCGEYMGGVYPVKGLAGIPQNATAVKHFRKLNSPLGIAIFGIQVDIYKDRWSTALRREWNGVGIQPEGHFSAPVDVTEAQLAELTVETKVPAANGLTEWRRPSGAKSELWDCLVYASAGIEILAYALFTERLKTQHIDWQIFWSLRQQQLSR